MTDKDDVVYYKGVVGSKKHCANGLHAQWLTEVDDFELRGEVCVVCGKKMMYSKTQVTGKPMGLKDLDFELYLLNHKVDLIQPYMPDGSRNPDFVKFYGETFYANERRK